MNKKIHLSDGITTPDKLNMNPKTGLDTQIIITARNGRHDGDFRVDVVKNMTVLNGRTKLLESVFPITPNTRQHLFINDNVLGEFNPETGADFTSGITTAHNTPASIMPRNNPALWRRRKVEYWCAGDGAINKSVLNQSYNPHITDTKLYHMIPFRFIEVSKTLPDEIRRQYKLEVIYGAESPYYGYKGYYFKKINHQPPANSSTGINMTIDKQPYVPKWSDTVPDLENTIYNTSMKGNKTQKSYIDMSMNISSEEFKEWFQFNDNTLSNATISEIGLITGLNARLANGVLEPMEDVPENTEGYDSISMRSEIYDSELFAHLTFDPYPVSRDNSTIDFEYRIYA